MGLLNILIAGSVTGGLYGLVAVGLVLCYKVSRAMNFALGGIGGLAAYTVFTLLGLNVPYAVSVVAAILAGAALGALSDVLVVGPLRDADHSTIAMGTLGLQLVLQGATGTIWGYETQALPLPLSGVFTLQIGTLKIGSASLFILLVTGLTLIGAFLFIQRTRLGMAMRATSSGPLTASLLGVNTNTIRTLAWSLSGACGAIAAIFVAPKVYLDPTVFGNFMMVAFAAMVLGGFSSFGGVLAGGVAFGVFINLVSTYVSTGLVMTTTFVVFMAVLMFRPSGLLGRPEQIISEPPVKDYTKSTILGSEAKAVGKSSLRQWSTYVVVLALLVAAPFVLPDATYRLANGMALFFAVLGINVLLGHSGQFSIGHSGFMAIGAYLAAAAIALWQWPVPAALVLAMVGAAVAGLIVGLPVTRLRGYYLTLLTMAFGWAVPEVLMKMKVVGASSGLVIPLPDALKDDLNRYWLILGVAVVVTAINLALERSSVGRHWRAVRDSELGAQSLGLDIARVRLGAFVWSAALAGIGGALMALLVHYVSPETYNLWLAIYLVLAVVVGGTGSVVGSLIGAMFLTLAPDYASNFHLSPDVVFGAVLMVLIVFSPEGIAALPSLIWRRLGRRSGGGGTADRSSVATSARGE